jgi:hypothetical protein
MIGVNEMQGHDDSPNEDPVPCRSDLLAWNSAAVEAAAEEERELADKKRRRSQIDALPSLPSCSQPSPSAPPPVFARPSAPPCSDPRLPMSIFTGKFDIANIIAFLSTSRANTLFLPHSRNGQEVFQVQVKGGGKIAVSDTEIKLLQQGDAQQDAKAMIALATEGLRHANTTSLLPFGGSVQELPAPPLKFSGGEGTAELNKQIVFQALSAGLKIRLANEQAQKAFIAVMVQMKEQIQGNKALRDNLTNFTGLSDAAEDLRQMLSSSTAARLEFA